MKKLLISKLKESVISVVPIVVIVVILSFILGFDVNFVFKFIFSSFFLIIGLALFTVGADISMIEIGQKIGSFLAKKNWIWLTLIATLFIGVIVTVAEPDLLVLAQQVESSINPIYLILAVAIGVGVFMVISILRTKFALPLNIIFIISYALVFILTIFLSNKFYPLALDSGSVTTGPISFPFIIAFGIGIAAVSATKGKSTDDSFGTVGLVSVGPILAVMLLGLILHTESISYSYVQSAEITGFWSIIFNFFVELPSIALKILIVILPILLLFLSFQIFALKLPFKAILQILIGICSVFLGITLFLTAVNYGFLSTGQSIGLALANLKNNWVLIPLLTLIGLVIELVEPAVHILTKQIEQVTSGVVSRKTIFLCLCIGVAVALCLTGLKIIFSIDVLWFVIPIFALICILTFIAPKMFTGIAFDAGGVVTGAMSTTFVLPMIIGFVNVLSGEAKILTDAFGSLSLIASAPILMIMLIGCFYRFASTKKNIQVKTKKSIVVEFE